MDQPAKPASPVPFHALSVAEVLAQLDSRAEGLTTEEAAARRARFGPNVLPPPHTRGPVERFLSQFNNAVIYVLLAAGTITALLQQWVDCGVIFGVVIINAVIGFIQEGRAEEAITAVRRLLSPQAMVLRGGRRLVLPAQELVPGDVILLQSGDRVPADARLLELRELRMDEAALTGESEPVEKDPRPVAEGAQIADRRCVVYSGTMVTLGRASAVVTATGLRTEIGRISAMLAGVEQLTTPLLRQLSDFGRALTIVILVAVAVIYLFGVYVRTYPHQQMFLAMVGLAVSAIPEALPAIITITLAVGVRRMAACKAIIRRLPAVETLGSVTVICSDKTGTLTRNEMSVHSVAMAGLPPIEVTGSGYQPVGDFHMEGRNMDPAKFPALLELCRAAMLCNESAIHETPEGWVLSGDPTDGALLALGMKAGLGQQALAALYAEIDAIPFESGHRFMATLRQDLDGARWIFVKGAPEAVLKLCARQHGKSGEEPLDSGWWHAQVERFGADAQRTIAIAARRCAIGAPDSLSFPDVRDLTLLGVVGIIDPPREEAMDSVRQCRSAGVQVKMVTGDHAGTAGAVARQIGLDESARPLSGADLDLLDDAQLADAVERATVFARTSPEHKLRLVEALQSRGHVVAMTGDGVNDAPALKRADVGVAMGIKGTEVAKEASQMVLADDNFASIVRAVAEGRTVFDNIRKAILYILPTNGGESFTILLAIAFGLVLPITPAHILWINMVTEVTLSVALAFEPPEPMIMRRRPRDPQAPILSGFMIWRVLLVSVLMVSCAFGLFVYEMSGGAELEAARTVAVNTLVVTQAAYLVNTRFLYASALTRAGLFGNRFVLIGIGLVLVLQMLFTYTPWMQGLFHTRAIGIDAWARIFAAGLFVFIAVEAEKKLLSRL
ncbi:MAG: cation-transporting P-type ATPase [Gammaproteobacteria bacterium]|nr:cation-transporting P-type ATPase [Gammaproteobacteria bacterium]